MTIGGWIAFTFISIVILLICFCTAEYFESGKRGFITAAIISFVLIAALLAAMLWWFNSTAKGKRSFKTQQSNLGDGIERVVEVYDVDGELIKRYDGKFDVVYDDDRILFDDEAGKRHIIYYPTGTVLIDEK